MSGAKPSTSALVTSALVTVCQAGDDGEPDRIREPVRAESSEHTGPVDFNRTYADAEILRDGFVAETRHQRVEHLTLAATQARHATRRFRDRLLTTSAPWLSQCGFQRPYQSFVVERLLNEVH